MAHRRLCSLAEALWLANTRYGSFGSPLGLVLPQDGGELRLRRLTATSSEVTMPYPAWAARPDNALCLPTALALADEISTFAGFALWDPRHRPGVSIALSGELVGHTHELPRVEPGEQLTFVTKQLRSASYPACVHRRLPEPEHTRGTHMCMCSHAVHVQPRGTCTATRYMYSHAVHVQPRSATI
jgi:hypothetical protein